MELIETKACSDCGPQPLTEFNNDKTRPDGLAPYCVQCFRGRNRESYARRSESKNNPGGDLRRCPECEEWLPLSEFGVNRARKDGVNRTCKSCIREMTYGTAEKRERKNARKRSAYREKMAVDVIPSDSRPDFIQTMREIGSTPGRIHYSLSQISQQTFGELKKSCLLETEELSDALTRVIGIAIGGKTVASRNGTGPRRYFLVDARIKPSVEEQRQRTAEAPLSFSSLNLPTTPIVRGDKFTRGGNK